MKIVQLVTKMMISDTMHIKPYKGLHKILELTLLITTIWLQIFNRENFREKPSYFMYKQKFSE